MDNLSYLDMCKYIKKRIATYISKHSYCIHVYRLLISDTT